MRRDPGIPPGEPRRIVGFHTDEEGHWVADLECGHGQHVRHLPPWQNRPWVLSEEGRSAHLGGTLECLKCAPAPSPGDTPAAVVRAWHEALNRGDGAAVLRLSDPEVELLGPRGHGTGIDLLRRWLAHARVRLEPLRTFARDDRVAVAQHAVWLSPETGDPVGEAEVASVFRVRAGRVTYYARFDGLDQALSHADLSRADRI